MKKLKEKLLIGLLFVPVIVLAAEAVATGNVKLTVGQYIYSSNAKIDMKYPFISTENNNSTSNAHFSSVLMKKGLFSYSNKQRLDKQLSNLGDHSYYFNSADSGTYRISLIGEDGTTEFDYAFTSSNERA